MCDNFPKPLVKAIRGGFVESIHRGHLVVCAPDGIILAAMGDKDFPTFMRSAAKPFQAIPVISEGIADKYDFSDSELALMCGSVSGQDFHVAGVRSILEKLNMDEAVLECGVHRPSHRPTAIAMAKRGEKPLAVHNNCAGKHAAMLALCTHHGWEVTGYSQPGHPVQEHIRTAVAYCCGLNAGQMDVGIDGCGVPVFRAPLRAIARGYARLADPDGDATLFPGIAEAMKRLVQAVVQYPEMIAGDGRICTEVMRKAPGRVLAKTGAEGSYGLSLLEKSQGIAFKVEDGSMRALPPAVIQILCDTGILSDKDKESLQVFARPPVKNHKKELVGYLEGVAGLIE